MHFVQHAAVFTLPLHAPRLQISPVGRHSACLFELQHWAELHAAEAQVSGLAVCTAQLGSLAGHSCCPKHLAGREAVRLPSARALTALFGSHRRGHTGRCLHICTQHEAPGLRGASTDTLQQDRVQGPAAATKLENPHLVILALLQSTEQAPRLSSKYRVE